jgi:hypothetical protein
MSHCAPLPLQAVTIARLGDEAALISLTGALPGWDAPPSVHGVCRQVVWVAFRLRQQPLHLSRSGAESCLVLRAVGGGCHRILR